MSNPFILKKNRLLICSTVEYSKMHSIKTHIKHLLAFCILQFIAVNNIQAQSKYYPLKKYLALGDSYTIGESVDTHENFPGQLLNRLNEKKEVIGLLEIIAKTGWTTDELINAIAEKKPSHHFDLVTLLIGVNNQYRGYDIEIYKKEFEELLQIAIKCAAGNKGHVIVLSIPDYGVTAFAAAMDRKIIHDELDKYNAASKQICDKKGVEYIDITPGSRKADDDASLIAKDNLHPSAKMYAQWVEALLPKAVVALGIVE